MSLCQLLPLFVVGSAAIGGAIAAFLGLDPFMGLTFGFLAGLSPLTLFGLGYALMMRWRPDRPVCRTGACGSLDYEFLEWRKSETEDGRPFSFVYRCRCGHRYIQHDKRFLELLDDGTEKPFMRVSEWGRWRRDGGDPEVC